MNTPEQPKNSPSHELPPPLRTAVDAAKTQPVPKRSQHRALRRATQNRPPVAPWLRFPELAAIASLAALLFFGVWFISSAPSPGEKYKGGKPG